MIVRLLLTAGLLGLPLTFAGCATRNATSRHDLSRIRTVAINYAPPRSGRTDDRSVSGDIAGRALRRGLSIGLGSLRLGLVAGLVGDVVDVSRPSSKDGHGKISEDVLKLLAFENTDPGWLVAQRTQAEIARRRLFTIRAANPDAAFEFELRRARLEPVDKLALQQRAALTMMARLRDRNGAVVWSAEAAATLAKVRTWQEYRERPALLRADFDALARTVARDFADDLAR